MPWTVFNRHGQRKYLTADEIDKFLIAAQKCDACVRTFCWTVAATGCRISEALSMGRNSIDFAGQQAIILCLKKRDKRVFRAIPLPGALLDSLGLLLQDEVLPEARLWPWSRMTGYRRICEVMRGAGLTESYASPKGLRHGFAVRAVQANVPLSLVQRWLGHADIKTTAIYTSATGPEEREFAARLWDPPAGPRRPAMSAARPPAAALVAVDPSRSMPVCPSLSVGTLSAP
jgi:integrase/recombinase XerD